MNRLKVASPAELRGRYLHAPACPGRNSRPPWSAGKGPSTAPTVHPMVVGPSLPHWGARPLVAPVPVPRENCSYLIIIPRWFLSFWLFFWTKRQALRRQSPGNKAGGFFWLGVHAPGKDVAGEVQALARFKEPVPQGGHHGGVVGAERRGRQEEVKPRSLGVLLQDLAQAAVGGDPAADHQAGAALLFHGQPGPAGEAVHHRGLKTGRQVATGRGIGENFRVLLQSVPDRGLEAGEREGEGFPVDPGPGEIDRLRHRRLRARASIRTPPG